MPKLTNLAAKSIMQLVELDLHHLVSQDLNNSA